MNAEIISIGDELTSGQRLDTNSQWLSERLSEIGIRVLYHTTVADDLAANVRVFEQAIERVDVVIATGGLGPTADDLTREALARVMKTELALDEAVLAHIRALFVRLGRNMPEKNVLQAMFPVGSRVVPNPVGTAPGVFIAAPKTSVGSCRVYALPGVPAEMFEMWRQTVAPELASLLPTARVIRHRRIQCFGASESEVESRMPDLIRRGRTPSVGITVSGATITLRITAEGATDAECYTLMEPTIATIHECLGHLVYGQEEDQLEDIVVRMLTERKQTLATAEWGTAGLVAQKLHDTGSPTFLGGIVVSSAQMLPRVLNKSTDDFAQLAPASAEMAGILASACREQYAADLGLAVSAFPALKNSGSEAPRVHFALATSEETISRSTPHFGTEDILKVRAAKQALNLIRLTLLSIR